MEKEWFYIEGMTCSGCERTLERAISRLEGVCAANANRQAGRLEVLFSAPCTREQIMQTVGDTGYGIADKPRRKGDALCFLVILAGLYTIARQLGWTELFRKIPTVTGEQLGYMFLFLLGLLTSVHCIAMCGGLNLAQSMCGGEHPVRRSILYNLGRLTSYTLIGGVLGFIGETAAISLRARGIIGLAAGVLMLAMGVCMMGVFPAPRCLSLKLPTGLEKGLAAFRRRGAYAIGLANGFMPCGPLQSMQLCAIASGSFLTGAMSMFFFCLGTIPLVLLFGIAAGVLNRNWRRGMLCFGSALLVLMGLFTVQNNLALTGIVFPSAGTNRADFPAAAVVKDGTQYVTTVLHANSFDAIQVTAGIPVSWTILADKDTLNGCNNELVLPAFGQQVKLNEGATTITFTPEEAGSYPYTCWMGMLKSSVIVTDGNTADSAK